MLTVRTVPIDSLTPAPYNPRRALKPASPAYRKLRRSLERFGLVEPLVWNEASGLLVGGHARLAILKELGSAEVPVAVVNLSAAEEKALNVVLNNREAQGRYDAEKLAVVLSELAELPELELTGFSRADLADLNLEPAGAAGPAEGEGAATVRVVAVFDAAQWERAAPAVDGWLSEGVEVRIDRRGG